MFRVFSFVVVSAGLACAQETVYHASVSGYVNDPSGAVVQNARVTARQAETNISTETVTNKDGRFRFPYLKVGSYTVTVQQPGFADDSRSLVLGIGGAYEVSFALMITGAETSVNVDANAAVLETARSQIAGTVATNEVRNMPLNGRNFLDLALLIPGVSPTNTGSNQLFAETSAVPGQGISVGRKM